MPANFYYYNYKFDWFEPMLNAFLLDYGLCCVPAEKHWYSYSPGSNVVFVMTYECWTWLVPGCTASDDVQELNLTPILDAQSEIGRISSWRRSYWRL